MTKTDRDPSIDAFRGLAIMLMVAANFLAGVGSVPPALKHAPDIGLTVIDLIAPMFITAIGLTYVPSFRLRRERLGGGAAAGHSLARYFAIAGIGALISAGEQLVGQATTRLAWGVLQAIGIAGVLMVPLALLPWWARLIAGLATLAGYQLLLDAVWLDLVLKGSHGGLPGTLGWFSMLALATVLAQTFRSARLRGAAGLLTSAGMLAAGIALSLVAPVSKNRVSSSYVLVSLGACGLLYTLMRLAWTRPRLRIRHLETWGANPLALYLLHYLLLAIVVLPGIPWWHETATPLVTTVQLVLLLTVLGLVARYLDRRGAILRL